MPYRLEVTLKSDLFDAEGETLRRKAWDYFGIRLDTVRTVAVVTIDADLTPKQLETIRREVFTNPVTQVSSFDPLPVAFDWTVWIGFRPGVRDNPGSTGVEAVEDILGIQLAPGEKSIHVQALLPGRQGTHRGGRPQDRREIFWRMT